VPWLAAMARAKRPQADPVTALRAAALERIFPIALGRRRTDNLCEVPAYSPLP